MAGKRATYSEFYPMLDGAMDKWRERSVIPYSRAYADAYSAFVSTKKAAEKDREARLELYISVAMLAGTAICGLAPVAGVIAAAKVPARASIVSLARAAGRLGIASRGAAWMTMSKFAWGTVPKLANAAWGSHGKTILKNSMSQFNGGASSGGAKSSDVRKPLRPKTNRDKMPIEYYLELEGMMLKVKNIISDCAEALIKSDDVTEAEFEQFCRAMESTSFMTAYPRVAPSERELEKLANEMEMALWTTAAASWKFKKAHTEHYSIRIHGRMGSATTYRTAYNSYLEEDRVLERIDLISSKLKLGGYYITGEIWGKKRTLKMASKWDDHFGAWHSNDEKNDLVLWARQYVEQRAKKAMLPHYLR